MAVVKKPALGCVGLLILACVVLLSLCTVSVWPKARTQPVDMYDLMLDVGAFPQGWDMCIGPAPPPEHVESERGEREFLYVGFCPEGFEQGIDGAEHDVFRYRNELDAAIALYSDFSRHEFSNRYTRTPWRVPGEWAYESQAADRFKFACGELEPFDLGRLLWKCRAVSQYDEYISVFSTTLSPEYMTFGDLERILAAIDERMAFYLGDEAE